MDTKTRENLDRLAEQYDTPAHDLRGSELLSLWEVFQSKHGGLHDLAEYMGITYGALRGRMKTARDAEKHAPMDSWEDAAGDLVRMVKTGDKNTMALESAKDGRIRTLADLLEVGQVDLETWAVDHYIENTWEVGAVVDEALTVETLYQVKAWLVRTTPVDLALSPVSVTVTPVQPPKKHARLPGGTGRALIVPDMQVGYKRDMLTGALDPFQDRAAIDVALQVAGAMHFDKLVFLGDLLDMTDWTEKFLRSPDTSILTQPALIESAWWLAQFKAAAPDAEAYLLEGNHEKRGRDAIAGALPAAYMLRAVGELALPPALSLPRLLGLHALGFTWAGDYPAGEVWLNDQLKCVHGNVARAGPGDTSKAMVTNSTHSTLFGHIHRIEQASRTVEERSGTRLIVAGSPGCLCRLDYKVPGHEKGQNWNQGFAVAHYDESGWHSVDFVPINHGRAIYHGQAYQGRDLAEALRQDTGIAF